MSEQQTAFPFEPVDHTRSRASDPATSHAAAQSIVPKAAKLMACVMSVSDSTPRTARELAELACEEYGGEVESYRKRARELCRKGQLVEMPPRPCLRTGRNATTYIKSL